MTMIVVALRSVTFIATCLVVGPLNAQPDLQPCVHIENDTARLACYDALAQTAAGTPGLVQAVLPASEPDAETRGFEATVTVATHRAFNGWTIDFDNGQSWRQIGTASFVVREGDLCTLRSTTPGVFLLHCGSRARRIQVTRVE